MPLPDLLTAPPPYQAIAKHGNAFTIPGLLDLPTPLACKTADTLNAIAAGEEAPTQQLYISPGDLSLQQQYRRRQAVETKRQKAQEVAIQLEKEEIHYHQEKRSSSQHSFSPTRAGLQRLSKGTAGHPNRLASWQQSQEVQARLEHHRTRQMQYLESWSEQAFQAHTREQKSEPEIAVSEKEQNTISRCEKELREREMAREKIFAAACKEALADSRPSSTAAGESKGGSVPSYCALPVAATEQREALALTCRSTASFGGTKENSKPTVWFDVSKDGNLESSPGPHASPPNPKETVALSPGASGASGMSCFQPGRLEGLFDAATCETIRQACILGVKCTVQHHQGTAGKDVALCVRIYDDYLSSPRKEVDGKALSDRLIGLVGHSAVFRVESQVLEKTGSRLAGEPGGKQFWIYTEPILRRMATEHAAMAQVAPSLVGEKRQATGHPDPGIDTAGNSAKRPWGSPTPAALRR